MVKVFTSRNKVALVLGLGAVGVAAVIAACSSSSSNDAATTTGGTAGSSGAGGGGTGGDNPGDGGVPSVDAGGSVGTQPGSCPNPSVSIFFSPMYSAFIPGSNAHAFAIPAVTEDGNSATWSLSDPSQGHLQLQSFQINGTLVPGVLITMAGTGNAAGEVSIIADEGNGVCGTSVLHVTQNTEDDWNIGNGRYNNGVALHITGPTGRPMGNDGGAGFRPDGGRGGQPAADAGSFYETDGGTACTNCHGPTATMGPYRTVSHTPEQTGGFSDTDLENIILNGVVPDGGYFDPSVLIPNCDGGAACTAQARSAWHAFHRWADITADELPGVICYLRSLTPQAQAGTPSFGGGGIRRDGGGPRGDGGGFRGDGGGARGNRDAGAGD